MMAARDPGERPDDDASKTAPARACITCWYPVPASATRCPECGGERLGHASWAPPTPRRVARQFLVVIWYLVFGILLLVLLLMLLGVT